MKYHTRVGKQWVQLEQPDPEYDCWIIAKYTLTLIAIAVSTVGLGVMLVRVN